MTKQLNALRQKIMARRKFLIGLVAPSKFEKNPIWISANSSPFKSPTPLTYDIYQKFQLAGTDKSSNHSYHYPYSFILNKMKKKSTMLEIGIGSTRPDIPFSMSWKKKYRPGSSLHAWQNLGFSKVVGADIDIEVVESCKDFTCLQVDQTQPESLINLRRKLDAMGLTPLDMIVDDGIHHVEFNLLTFEVLSPILIPGGIYVIEDLKQSDIKTIIFKLEQFNLSDWHIWINPFEGENCVMLIIEMNRN